METELERFAEQVRRRASEIMAAGIICKSDRVIHLAGELCTFAANVTNRRGMERELADPDRFDLAALASLPMAAPESGEDDAEEDGPFAGE